MTYFDSAFFESTKKMPTLFYVLADFSCSRYLRKNGRWVAVEDLPFSKIEEVCLTYRSKKDAKKACSVLPGCQVVAIK